jgi:hypothetical protein
MSMNRGGRLVLEYFQSEMERVIDIAETRGQAVTRIMGLTEDEFIQVIEAMKITAMTPNDGLMTSIMFGFWYGQKKLVEDATETL